MKVRHMCILQTLFFLLILLTIDIGFLVNFAFLYYYNTSVRKRGITATGNGFVYVHQRENSFNGKTQTFNSTTDKNFVYRENTFNGKYKEPQMRDIFRSPASATTPGATTKLPIVKCKKHIAILSQDAYVLEWTNDDFKRLFIHENNILQTNITCPEQLCNVTLWIVWTQTSYLNNSDGVFLHYSQSQDLQPAMDQLLSTGRNDTTIIFYARESPLMATHLSYKKNLTLSPYHIDINYHSHSSVPFTYGYYNSSSPLDDIPGKNWAQNKTHLIAWMASNCKDTFWPRTDFVYDLRKHIPVDMYGKCGNIACAKTPNNKDCKIMLRKYKFYLALENSECDEYITEKCWDNALNNGIVPVVYGGRKSAYEKLAPPNSFIHIADFENTKALANYLLELDKNDTKYNEYFQWRLKGHVVISDDYVNMFCNAIPFLNSRNQIKRKVTDLAYFNSCREKPGERTSDAGYVGYSTWSPWK